MEIAMELDYIPNMAGRTLKKQQTKIIGLYLTNYGGAFYGELINSINEKLSTYGYEIIVCSGEQSHLFLPEKLVDAAIILDATFPTNQIKLYADRDCKIVLLDRELEHPNVCSVMVDNATGAKTATNYLLRQRLNKIYIVSGPEHNYDNRIRLEASIRELKQQDVPYEIIHGDYTKSAGRRAAAIIHEEWTGERVGVFCLNDEMAIGIYDYMETKGISIGPDICVIGFDNTELGSYLKPRLATISYSMEEWGMIASKKIIALLNGERCAAREQILTELIMSSSVST